MAFDPSNCGPLDVAFSNSSEGEYNAYNWDFEISTSTLTDPFNVIFPPTDTIVYYAIELTASNFCGTSIEADSILVNPLPIVDFIGSLDSLWGCSPLHISFNNMSTGIPDNYLWEYGDGDFSTLFEEQEHVYFADSTIMVYETTLIATNECGVDSMSLYVTVKPNTVSAFHQIPFNTGCEPFLVCFTDYSEGVDNGTSTYNFGNGESSSLFEPCYTFDDAGSYIVSQIVSNGCAFDTAYSYITVLEQPEISVFADTNKVCANVPVYFTSNVNTLVNYTWNFNDGYQSNESSPNHIFANSGPYWVILDAVGANNCSASDSVQIQVYSVPIANFTFPSATGCSPFQLCASSAVSAGNFYYWDFGDGTTGVGNVSCHNYINPGNTIINYDVTLYVENVFQCRDTAIQEINILPQPTSAFNLGSFESCSYPISVATNNFSQEAFGYEWYINGDSVTNEFNPALTFDTVGNYQINLVAINQYNCTSSSIAEFEVHPVPVIDFILNPPSGCTPLIVEIQNNTAEANDYIWSLGDGAIDYSTNPTHIYEPPGTYDIQLIATNNFGCRDTLLQEDAIEVYPVPYPEISYNPSQPSVYDKQIYFQDVGGGASSWDWNFGDGNYGYVQFYQHEYMFPATYIVTLNVQNEYGCTARDVASITIKEDFMIFVPNAFTPHIPDGTNDYFKPIIQGENLIQRYKFQIFNRWGDVVFETNDPKEAWVGNHRGGDYYVEDGIYNWTIEVDILNGDETKFLNGHVTIIR
jgi:gliding motility-associated-like protein